MDPLDFWWKRKEDYGWIGELRRQGKLEGLIRRAQQENLSPLLGEYLPKTALMRLGFDWPKTPKEKRPYCGAKCRDGHACRAKVADGSARCKMHGGWSTGPRTEAGIEAIRESNRRRAKNRQADAAK